MMLLSVFQDENFQFGVKNNINENFSFRDN